MKLNDPKAMRALAHPLRLDLLEVLSMVESATAAWCGRALGVPQANCSFHLRQLGKYGFVEEAEPGEDRRERRWRLVEGSREMRVDVAGADTAAAEAIGRRLERTVVEREMAAILRYAERRSEESPQWRGKAGVVSALAVVSADDMPEIERKWQELLRPYLARAEARGEPGVEVGDAAAGGASSERRLVRYFMAATPVGALDGMTGDPVEGVPEGASEGQGGESAAASAAPQAYMTGGDSDGHDR
ncbi:helix-turn-helix domain-containing protein [Streptomyces sp. NBC_00669]|uniref:ArsR/SmtB family transcription factor n=1 Tax=Streptomyces sp. NBC_00669 TaxID=2976011 RepID=UPI002E33BD68|nr:helix-turn-helix domain-containing protein [Streptomyces sp. NBC_00669]